MTPRHGKTLVQRLARAAAEFMSAAASERETIERIARRHGVSHTTLRKTLRRLEVLAPKQSRKGKT